MTTAPETQTAAWTIGRLLQWTAEFLEQNQVEDARLSAEILLACALDCQRIQLYTRFEVVPEAEVVTRFRDMVKRASKGEPIAYLVESKEFFSLTFRVSPDVLIPRPESETLVECVVDCLKDNSEIEAVFLDMGTGSGCLSIAILKQIAGVRAVATDISAGALSLAQENAEKHLVVDRLTLIEADRLTISTEVIPAGGFDVILSNPPYVAAEDMADLPANVRDFEPTLALSDGQDGLSFYRSIGKDAPALLKPGGAVFVEIEAGKTKDVIRVVEEAGPLRHSGTWRDRVVGADRVLGFTLET